MSADTCIAYFGLRYEISSEEIEAIELRSDRRVVAARQSGLKYYWGNFGGAAEQHLLFIGTELGLLGSENSVSVNIPTAEVQRHIENTQVKLLDAGFKEAPSLHLQWHMDVS